LRSDACLCTAGTVGLFERFHGEKLPDMPSLLQSNRHMRDVLLAKGYPVNYGEVPGGHEIYVFELSLPDELIFLVGTRTPDKEARPN
jgi:enterochelin esterase-like enzyme